jgi:hypothetical protein
MIQVERVTRKAWVFLAERFIASLYEFKYTDELSQTIILVE